MKNRLVYPENEIVLVAEKLQLLVVDIAAMTDVQNQNQNLVVLNIGNQAVVPDAIAPLPAAIGGQSFSMLTRIGTSFQIFSDLRENQHRSVFI